MHRYLILSLFCAAVPNFLHASQVETKKFSSVKTIDSTLNLSLMEAARDGRTQTIESLFSGDKLPEVNTTDKDGWTALMYVAAFSGKPCIARKLLAAGADVNAFSAQGTTALMLAAREEQIDLVELLIAAGAHLNAKNKSGITPLMMAFSGSNLIRMAGQAVDWVILATLITKLVAAGSDHTMLSAGKTARDYIPYSETNKMVYDVFVKEGLAQRLKKATASKIAGD